MTHFHELEEQNLSLIQQQQENEQQIDKNRKEFESMEETKNRQLATLAKTVEENKQRSSKIIMEKKMLEMQTNKKGDGNISAPVYQKLVKQISEIRDSCDKKRARGQNVPDPSL